MNKTNYLIYNWYNGRLEDVRLRTKKEAKLAYKYFSDKKEERLIEFQKLMESEYNLEEKNIKQLDEIIYKYAIDEAKQLKGKTPKERYDFWLANDFWNSLALDIVIYIGELIIQESKGIIYWDLKVSTKNNLDNNFPCLFGFKNKEITNPKYAYGITRVITSHIGSLIVRENPKFEHFFHLSYTEAIQKIL